MAETRWHAFRRAKTRDGYRKIEAEAYMPGRGEAFVPNLPKCALYGYVAVEREKIGGGEFGLVIAPRDSGGRWVVLVYRSLVRPGGGIDWQYVRHEDGRPVELPAGKAYRLVAAADDGRYKTWVYDAAGAQLVYREWQTAVVGSGQGQHVRRVASIFAPPGVRAYGTIRWRNVLVGTASETHHMGPADLLGGAPENRTCPPGHESEWVRATVIRAYSDEDIGFDVRAETDAATAAVTLASPLAAVAAARILESKLGGAAGAAALLAPP